MAIRKYLLSLPALNFYSWFRSVVSPCMYLCMKVVSPLQLSKLVRPKAQSACDHLKQVNFVEDMSPEAEKEINQTLKFGTSLFELYLDVQSFVE